MNQAVELFVAINCLVVGLSHVLQPGAWVTFFVWLRDKGSSGVFVNGLLSLSFGALIAAFHNVWHGLPAVITVLGWLQILKGALSLIAPQIALRSMARVRPDRAHEFRIAGAVLIGLGLIAGYVAMAV